MDKPLHGGGNFELHGISFAVVLGNAAGLAAEKLYDRVVAEMKFPGLLQIHYARERDHALDGGS